MHYVVVGWKIFFTAFVRLFTSYTLGLNEAETSSQLLQLSILDVIRVHGVESSDYIILSNIFFNCVAVNANMSYTKCFRTFPCPAVSGVFADKSKGRFSGR